MTHNFEFETPLTYGWTTINHKRMPKMFGNLKISGTGEYSPRSPKDEQIEYTLNEISIDGEVIPMSIIEFLRVEETSKLDDIIHASTVAHLEKHFRGDFAVEIDDETDIDRNLEFPSSDDIIDTLAKMKRA